MTVHIVLQGKGGVGKTLVASMIAEYCLRGGLAGVIDMDPKNGSLSEFSGFSTEKVRVNDGGSFAEADDLFNAILESKPSDCWVIDTAGESFDAVLEYLVNEGVAANLEEANHTVYCHVVIVGGASQMASGMSLAKATESLKETAVNVVVWNNDYFGDVDGSIAGNVVDIMSSEHAGTVFLTTRERRGLKASIERKYIDKLTTDEVIGNWKMLERNRIIRFYNDIFVQLDAISISKKKSIASE